MSFRMVLFSEVVFLQVILAFSEKVTMLHSQMQRFIVDTDVLFCLCKHVELNLVWSCLQSPALSAFPCQYTHSHTCTHTYMHADTLTHSR